MEKAMTEQERQALIAVSKQDPAYTYDANSDTDGADDYTIAYATSELAGDKMFSLSAEEAVKYFSDHSKRIAKYRGTEGYYWLRSPFAGNTVSAGRINAYNPINAVIRAAG